MTRAELAREREAYRQRQAKRDAEWAKKHPPTERERPPRLPHRVNVRHDDAFNPDYRRAL
jgi:hypothetical protein